MCVYVCVCVCVCVCVYVWFNASNVRTKNVSERCQWAQVCMASRKDMTNQADERKQRPQISRQGYAIATIMEFLKECVVIIQTLLHCSFTQDIRYGKQKMRRAYYQGEGRMKKEHKLCA
jgi:hypothetical protein